MLDEILHSKKAELAETRLRIPLHDLMDQLPEEPPASFRAAITQPSIRIIAEIKYRSPSHGPFRCQRPPEEVGLAYQQNGAAALSVLTEKSYFDGDLKFLDLLHQKSSDLPLLRKDFIFDPYQVIEARVHGASAYLLIVACLSRSELQQLLQEGRECSLEALVEVHDPFELDAAIESGARIIGVNNRNLRTFKVDLDTSFDIARRLEGEQGFTLVSESGIREVEQIRDLQDAGFSAFLVGSSLMDTSDPGAALRALNGAPEPESIS